MMFSHSVEFNIGDEVWSKTDEDAHGVVIWITFRPCGVLYIVAWGIGDEASCYAIELLRDKRITA